MIFFKEKFWEFPQYFQISSKISNFQRKILRISKDFIEIFFKFSLNFHSIFKRNFWFCEIHLKIERNWERKKNYKNLSFVWRESGKKQFWKILVIFGTIFWKINLNFWQLPILQQFSQNSIIHFLKFGKNLEKI